MNIPIEKRLVFLLIWGSGVVFLVKALLWMNLEQGKESPKEFWQFSCWAVMCFFAASILASSDWYSRK